MKYSIKLFEGGAYGHLMHPYENFDLKFSELKEIINGFIKGGFGEKNLIKEKIDGVNIFFTIKNNELRIARNKTHLKNYGKLSLNRERFIEFLEKNNIPTELYIKMYDELENALFSLGESYLNKVFQDGVYFINAEIVYPDSSFENVIKYDKKAIIFHELIEVNESGERIGEILNAEKRIIDLLKQKKQNIQDTFIIDYIEYIKLEPLKNANKILDEINKKIDSLLEKNNLKESNTILDYFRKEFEVFLNKNLPNNILNDLKENDALVLLIDRYINYKKTTKNEFKKLGLKTETIDYIIKFGDSDIVKDYFNKILDSLIEIFIEVSIPILKNLNSFLVLNPYESKEKILKNLELNLNFLYDKSSTVDVDHILNKVKSSFEKLKKYGLENISNIEGLIFYYNGNYYKLTGLFKYLNNINGYVRFFDRYTKNYISETYSDFINNLGLYNLNEGLIITKRLKNYKPVNIFIGRFQPLHLGHAESIRKAYNKNKCKVVIVKVLSKSMKNERFSEKLSIEILKSFLNDPNYKKYVEDFIIVESAAIDKIVKELRYKGYELKGLIAGEDRMAPYKLQVDIYKDDLDLLDVEFILSERLTSASYVAKLIQFNDYEKFLELTPDSIHKFYDEMRDEILSMVDDNYFQSIDWLNKVK